MPPASSARKFGQCTADSASSASPGDSTRRPLGAGPGARVSAGRRSAGGSRWRGTRADMARGWPTSPELRRARRRAGRRLRETASLRDGHRRGCWYRRQSRTSTLVGQIADLAQDGSRRPACSPLPLKLARRSLKGAALVSAITRRSPAPPWYAG